MPATSPVSPANASAAARRPSTDTSRAAVRAATHADAAPSGRPTHLSVDDVSHAFRDRRVLTGISFTARPGDRLGLIGENGTGKSTLLRLIAGELAADRGSISVPGSVGLLAQELPYPDSTPVARVLDDAQSAAVAALAALEEWGARMAEQPDDPGVAAAFADALERAEHDDAWAAEARRGDTLSGLGLGRIELDRPIGQLSGGQRLRLALAALLLSAPHTILLDEPSNHLDDESAAYLERVLTNWPGIVIVASHDRALLDAITTRILDLDPLPVGATELADAETGSASTGVERHMSAPTAATETTADTGSGFGARLWGVGYSEARAAKRREIDRWRERYAQESEERRDLLHEIEVGSREVNRKHESKSESRITRKFYADKDARVTARRARNARVRLDALERDRVRRPPEPLTFSGFATDLDRSGTVPPATKDGSRVSVATHPDSPVLIANNVSLAGRLRPTSLTLASRGRILLTGPNGAGKSTLLAILSVALEPSQDPGASAADAADQTQLVRLGRIGYLPQESHFERPDRTAADHYREIVGHDRAELHPLAQTGLLAARDLDRPVASLSVGQRRRLVLATLVADPPDALLLDEPTNHLSLTLVEELEEALQDFAGALIVASHDRWLRSRWQGEVMELQPAR
ncbi:ABC-F family ATP-binding cassette domain-containing protein [Leucobacter sp. USHLN153]|uniref:ABC-F family ATP-binding cassette domain-containing protein n=1 Tax=Leucobacter sp. USHLN153 TaxID=3081268 RepID=UPI003019728D